MHEREEGGKKTRNQQRYHQDEDPTNGIQHQKLNNGKT